jgi:hypothetical protein
VGEASIEFRCGITADVVAILQPRNVLFQLFDLRTEVAAVLKVLLGCAAFHLQTIMFAAQRRRLLFQRLVLGLEWGQISGRRLSSHDGQLCNRPTARVPTA